MTFMSNNADASFYYHEDAAADFARMDSSAIYGNLADVMKNATVPLPPPQIIQITMVSPPCLEDKQVDLDSTKNGGTMKEKNLPTEFDRRRAV